VLVEQRPLWSRKLTSAFREPASRTLQRLGFAEIGVYRRHGQLDGNGAIASSSSFDQRANEPDLS
jgi:hypothetical protein